LIVVEYLPDGSQFQARLSLIETIVPMRFALVSFEEAEVDKTGPELRSAFDRKLELALAQGDSPAVVVHLRADMQPSLDLLEWLEQWTKRFAVAGMRCVIVPQTPDQLETLEMSHPDQNLSYAASLDEIEIMFPPPPKQAPKPKPVHDVANDAHALKAGQDQATTSQDSEAIFELSEPSDRSDPIPVKKQTRPAKKPAPIPEPEPEELPEEPVMEAKTSAVGALSTLTGEYTCMGCKVSRMWLKGETMKTCENPECLNPDAGWQLAFDVF
jgi:hypothetical protein